MLNWLRRAPALTKRDLERAVADVHNVVDRLEEELQALRAQHLKLRGRVYALWGASETPDEATTPRNLNDPKLTKAQVRAALMASGRLRAVPTTTDE